MDREFQEGVPFGVGDIVEESMLLVPPGRKPWVGIVIRISEDRYFCDEKGTLPSVSLEIFWPSQGYTEHLPKDMVKLIEKKS